MELATAPNLTKRDLVVRISNETGIAQHRIAYIIDRALDHLMEGLSRGETIEFRNFGVFQSKLRKARIGRNPHRPEQAIPISSRTVVKFKAGKTLKARVMKLTAEKFPSERMDTFRPTTPPFSTGRDDPAPGSG